MCVFTSSSFEIKYRIDGVLGRLEATDGVDAILNNRSVGVGEFEIGIGESLLLLVLCMLLLLLLLLRVHASNIATKIGVGYEIKREFFLLSEEEQWRMVKWTWHCSKRAGGTDKRIVSIQTGTSVWYSTIDRYSDLGFSPVGSEPRKIASCKVVHIVSVSSSLLIMKRKKER
jgi:hypothetical protein